MDNCSVKSWYESSQSFDWNDHKIIYKIADQGKPWLLLIHGFPTASFDWHKVWKPLSEKYSLIAVDMLGFGYSDKPTDFPYSIMKQADLVEDLLQHLEITAYHILAHDYGDTVTQELIARYNEGGEVEIKSACLLNGGIFPESHHPLTIQKLLMSPLGFLLSKLLNQSKFERSFGSVFGKQTPLTKAELADYWELVSYKNGHRIAHLIIKYMKERVVNRERWVGALQNFQHPLGLINGPEDPISGSVMVDRFREIIQEENIWILEEIGHYPQVEAAEEMLGYYDDFRLKKKGGS